MIPVAAKVVPVIPGKIVSKPKLPRLTIAIGTNAQCRPNITKHCQNAPTTSAVTTGESLYKAAKKLDNT